MSDADQLKADADDAFKSGQLATAVALYTQALEQRPAWAAAHNNLAMALRHQGDHAAAEKHFRRALADEPDLVGALRNLGGLLVEQNQLDEAEIVLSRAANLQPDNAGVFYNWALSALVAGRLPDSIIRLEQATTLNPSFAPAWVNLGLCYRRLGDVDRARTSYEKAIEVDPGLFDAHLNIAKLATRMGDYVRAKEAGAAALGLNPESEEAHYNIGYLHTRIPEYQAALHHYERALEINPNAEEAANNRARPLLSLGRRTEAYDSLKKAVEIDPLYAAAHSNMIFFMQYDPLVSAQDIWAEARSWNEKYTPPSVTSPTPTSRDPDRVLRVGYLSPHLVQHPIGYFLEPVLAHHSTEQVEVICYDDSEVRDEQKEALKAAINPLHDVSTIGHDALAERIRADGIDILVDLDGHSGPNRLPVFARRGAPIQITWAGYVGTTGLDAMDYLITDSRQTVDADLPLMTEQPVYMPGNYVTLAPIDSAPAVGSSPSQENGFVTFACFNGLDKINEAVVTVWADVLKAVPGSQLRLVTFDLADATVRARIEQMFAEHGISADRLRLKGKLSRADLLAAYNTIDIALDPFPYSGGLTTLEALWMGVPVITKRDGDRFASRHSTTHLTAVGLTEFIADDAEDYVARAVSLAADADRRANLRVTLRETMRSSPLCNGAAFTQALENAYRIMWQRFCAGAPKAPILEAELMS